MIKSQQDCFRLLAEGTALKDEKWGAVYAFDEKGELTKDGKRVDEVPSFSDYYMWKPLRKKEKEN